MRGPADSGRAARVLIARAAPKVQEEEGGPPYGVKGVQKGQHALPSCIRRARCARPNRLARYAGLRGTRLRELALQDIERFLERAPLYHRIVDRDGWTAVAPLEAEGGVDIHQVH
jgi:hypothetical protein